MYTFAYTERGSRRLQICSTQKRRDRDRDGSKMSVPTDQDDRPNKSIPPVKESKRKAKPWDHPKRPLSAYNFFFQAERKAIVAAVDEAQKRKKKMGKSDAKDAPAKAEENPVKSEPTTEYTYILDDETLERLLTPDGKISFEQIGKLIGQNWKKVDPVRLAKYTEMAKQDRRRYKQEMDAFNLRHHARELRKQEQDYGRNPSVGVPFRPAKMARAGEANRNIGYSYPAGMPGASAFSHVIQPARSFDSYENYPYAMSHQFPMYYPPNYPGYGMAPSQESRFASLPGPPSVSQYPTYGREAYASSGAYRGTMGGGGYSYGDFEPQPPHGMQSTSSQQEAPQGHYPSQALQGNRPDEHHKGDHPGQAYSSQDLPPPGTGPPNA